MVQKLSAHSVWTRLARALPPYAHLLLYWQCWDLWHQQNVHTDKVAQRSPVLCSSCGAVCSSVCSNSLSAELLVLLSRSPFPHLFLFLSFGHRRNFPWLPWQSWLFGVILFCSTSLLEDVLQWTLAPISFLPLRVTCSCSHLRVNIEISYTCGIATGQKLKPYALSPYLGNAGNLRVVPVVSSPSEWCFGKTFPWSLWHSCSPSAALLVACPVQNYAEFSLNCCIFFPLPGKYHCVVWKKPFLLDLNLTVWRLIAYASRQSTI